MPTVKRKTVDKVVNCILPDNLDSESLRKAVNTLHKKEITDVKFWRYLRFIDLLTSDRRKDADGWVTLWHKVLIANLTSEYLTVKDDLIRLGIVETFKKRRNTDSYSADNNESKKYRMTDTFRHESLVVVEAKKRVAPIKPKAELEDERTKLLLSNASTPEYGYLKGCLHKLRYDLDAVKADFWEWYENRVKVKGKPFDMVMLEMMRRAVGSLNRDEFRFSVGMSGRINTPLTNSYKVLRRRLKIDGYDGVIKQADVSSTQIILMLPDMRAYKKELTDRKGIEELSNFEVMLRTGEFYKVLAAQLEAEGVVIKDIKKDFLRLVCNYREGRSQSSYYKAFSRLYPTVTEFLNVLKNGRSFTTVMTPVEAELFNNRIARRVYQEMGSQTFLAGIYDAFIFKESDEPGIVAIMNQEVYKMTGLPNMVKVTTLAEESEKHLTYPNQAPEVVNECLAINVT